MSHFFHYTWDKFDHVLDHHFKTIKAMKVKFCIPVKVIGIHILTIKKSVQEAPFPKTSQEKEKSSLFLKLPKSIPSSCRVMTLQWKNGQTVKHDIYRMIIFNRLCNVLKVNPSGKNSIRCQTYAKTEDHIVLKLYFNSQHPQHRFSA